jgi:tRNA 2-thiouridine synthesizing protein A
MWYKKSSFSSFIVHNKESRPWRKKMNILSEREAQCQDIRKETVQMSDAQKLQINQELNLKGKICPYTFVESMLALEEMEIGEVLRVIVDYPPAACDVPKSLRGEGYEILDVSKINESDWAIVVRNREFDEV